MDVAARPGTPSDLDRLLSMYRALEGEQSALRPLWSWAEGLPEPLETALQRAVDDPGVVLLVGTIDGVPLGFVLAGAADLLPQAEGEQVGQIRFIFTERAARGVGVGEAMAQEALAAMRDAGLTRFDARVSPGHREAKNFFEAAGFSARAITMHHQDDDGS